MNEISARTNDDFYLSKYIYIQLCMNIAIYRQDKLESKKKKEETGANLIAWVPNKKL